MRFRKENCVVSVGLRHCTDASDREEHPVFAGTDRTILDSNNEGLDLFRQRDPEVWPFSCWFIKGAPAEAKGESTRQRF
jgi:hypothetical protein